MLNQLLNVIRSRLAAIWKAFRTKALAQRESFGAGSINLVDSQPSQPLPQQYSRSSELTTASREVDGLLDSGLQIQVCSTPSEMNRGGEDSQQVTKEIEAIAAVADEQNESPQGDEDAVREESLSGDKRRTETVVSASQQGFAEVQMELDDVSDRKQPDQIVVTETERIEAEPSPGLGVIEPQPEPDFREEAFQALDGDLSPKQESIEELWPKKEEIAIGSLSKIEIVPLTNHKVDKGEPNQPLEAEALHEWREPPQAANGKETMVTPRPDSEVEATESKARPTISKDRRTNGLRLRPREDPGEYVLATGQFAPVPDEYRIWNHAIAEHLLLRECTGSDVYLTVTPRVLAGAMAEFANHLMSAQEADASFTDAVSGMYHVDVLSQGGKLRLLRRLGDNGIPQCIGFLALSVLAAYQMRSDEEAAGHAYYIRLANVLKCEISGSYPVGYDPEDFESLWLFVKSWLEKQTGARLVIPSLEETGFRRYVALPLAHVPLRSLDVEKLPDFFVRTGYQPGSKIPMDRLESDLLRWDRSRSALTPTGAAALNDNRRAAVLAQVAGELESWDGSIVESINRRSAMVEIMLDLVQRRADLFYYPRRPAGFPKTFDDGNRLFEAAEDGWYDPQLVSPDDGELLAEGFEWHSTSNGMQIVLRRSGGQAIALTPSEYSNFLSHPNLVRGVKCAVLCQERLARTATDYLSHISQQNCRPIADPRLPLGWNLFAGIVPRQIVSPPSGLESLEVDANVEIVLSGGLRLGRRSAWLAGAPPRIFVSGLGREDRVTVDGECVPVSDDGVLQTDRLSEVGGHIIEAGGARRRVEVIEPTIAMELQPEGGLGPQIFAVALPSGYWTLIGALTGEVVRVQSHHMPGTIAKCGFMPVWAIQVASGPGAIVAAVGPATPPRIFEVRNSHAPRRRAQIQAWTSVIYNANLRHPLFRRIGKAMAVDSMAQTWNQYVVEAKRIKRAFKKM